MHFGLFPDIFDKMYISIQAWVENNISIVRMGSTKSCKNGFSFHIRDISMDLTHNIVGFIYCSVNMIVKIQVTVKIIFLTFIHFDVQIVVFFIQLILIIEVAMTKMKYFTFSAVKSISPF